jgi:hypothetical protein
VGLWGRLAVEQKFTHQVHLLRSRKARLFLVQCIWQTVDRKLYTKRVDSRTAAQINRRMHHTNKSLCFFISSCHLNRLTSLSLSHLTILQSQTQTQTLLNPNESYDLRDDLIFPLPSSKPSKINQPFLSGFCHLAIQAQLNN